MNSTQLNPRIAVIVPCYNIESYVRTCLDSLAAQTHDSFEVICIDDESVDKTGRILDEYAATDKRFKVIHQKRHGASGARNVGIAASTAPLITFVDGDDYVSSRYLEVLDALLETHDADMACCSHATSRRHAVALLDDNDTTTTRALALAQEYNASETMRYIATEVIPFSFWNKLMSRELIESYPFPEGMVYEDMWNLGLVVNQINCVVYSPISLYCYLSRDNSTTRSKRKSIDRFWQFRDAVKKFEDAYIQCLGIKHATDDGAYCLHLVHRLCGQYTTLQNSICDATQRKELESALFDELDAAYHLAKLHGVPATHPQMMRAIFLLHSPAAHNALLSVYRYVSG